MVLSVDDNVSLSLSSPLLRRILREREDIPSNLPPWEKERREGAEAERVERSGRR